MAKDHLTRAGGHEEDAVDERLVERSVAVLRGIVVEGQVGLMIQAGEHILEHYYGGPAQARSHRPRKPASLRRLMERAAEFGMTATGVRTAPAIALQAGGLGRSLALRLGVAQHRALLPLRDPAEKKVLAEAAVDAGWSADHLRTRLHRIQKKHKGGRPARPQIETLISRADRALDKELVARRRALSEGVDAAGAKALLAKVEGMQRRLELLERELVRILGR